MVHFKDQILCDYIRKCFDSKNKKNIIYYYTKIGYYLFHQYNMPLYTKRKVINVIQIKIKKDKKVQLPSILV